MGRRGRNRELLTTCAVIAICSQVLSGCIAAVPLMIAGEGAAVGYSGYKLVQTGTGGSVGVHFRMNGDKEAPPEALPPLHAVAVWPSTRREVAFAEKLEQAHRFRVVAPATIFADLADVKVPEDLNQMTDEERNSAFATVCRREHVDMVFAARSLGTTSNDNAFSLSRANVTNSADVMGYSCATKRVAWTDELSLIIELGSSTPPSDTELATVAGNAWADRVVQAMGGAAATTQAAK